MSEETKLEVIKALAYGEKIETIANMAETEPEEIERIHKYAIDLTLDMEEEELDHFLQKHRGKKCICCVNKIKWV